MSVLDKLRQSSGKTDTFLMQPPNDGTINISGLIYGDVDWERKTELHLENWLKAKKRGQVKEKSCPRFFDASDPYGGYPINVSLTKEAKIGRFVSLWNPMLLEAMIFEDRGILTAIYNCARMGCPRVYFRNIRREIERLIETQYRQEWQKLNDLNAEYVKSISPYCDETWEVIRDRVITDERWELAHESLRKALPLLTDWAMQSYYVDEDLWEGLLAKYVDLTSNPIVESTHDFALKKGKETKPAFVLKSQASKAKEVYSGNKSEPTAASAAPATNPSSTNTSCTGTNSAESTGSTVGKSKALSSLRQLQRSSNDYKLRNS